jgi:thioredoxin-like negative regulator of GroEL
MNGMIVVLALHVAAAPPTTGYQSYPEAYQESKESGKPLVVFVCASWCSPCQTMKNSVLPEMKRRGILKRFAVALVDVDRDRSLVQRLGAGGAVPQLFCYSRSNARWYRSRIVGGREADQVEQFLLTATEKHDPGLAGREATVARVKE